MRNLKGFISFCVLVMFCGTVSAQIKIVIDNQEIPTTDIESIVILPNSNLISVRTSVAYTVQASSSSVDPTPAGAVSISGFTVSAATIIEGQNTTLSWTTQNASSCAASGGTGGWNTSSIGVPNGNKTISFATAGTYTFTLSCQDSAGGSAAKSISVKVNPPSTAQACATPSISGNVKSWSSFWLLSYPGPGSDSRYLTIPQTGYIALKFNTGNFIDDGKMTTIETTVTDGIRLGSFSECPGDFDVAPECDFVWGISGGIRWATNGRAGACQLKPNTDYYFNVTFTNGVVPSTTSCKSTRCVTTLQHSNR